MKLNLPLLFTVALTSGFALTTGCVTDSAAPSEHASRLNAEQGIINMANMQIENLQGQKLGRVYDLGIDLVNGRIITVQVVSGQFLGMGGKVVGVPPLALVQDKLNHQILRLDMSKKLTKGGAFIDVKSAFNRASIEALGHKVWRL